MPQSCGSVDQFGFGSWRSWSDRVNAVANGLELRVQIVALALRHTVPSVSGYREFVAGGLMSYGSSETDYYRLVDICAGKILSGEKPADLSVMQSTKFDFSQRRIVHERCHRRYCLATAGGLRYPNPPYR